MIKKITVVVVGLVGAMLIYATTRPNTMHVQRATVINAPPEVIFPLIDDFHRWSSWSPYEKLDPAMKSNYSGAPSGRGAVYEWEGNSDVGQGRMEIIDDPQPSRIVIKLDFIKPFEGHDLATFTLTPQGGATLVAWTMDGPSPYVAKLMGVFVDMDKMIGKDFESGLANLKSVAER